MRTSVALLVLLLAACGDRTDAPVRGAGRSAPAAPVARQATDADTAANSVPAAPAVFAALCVSGDPAVGSPWVLSGADPALTPLAIEPIETMASRDSARLAARIARTVDVMPSDTTLGDFRGLPVVVRAAWRLVPALGDTIIAALVARRMPIESNPLEELFFLVAIPGQRQGVRDPLVGVWVVREVASEEESAMRELLAGYTAPERLTLVLAWDSELGVRSELLSRKAGEWGLEWSGALASCAP